MQAAIKMCQNIKNLSVGMVFFAVFSRPDVQNIIVKLNTEGQLQFGVLSNGDVLPNYSRVSQEFYGKEDTPIQLKDTGAFWDSYRVVKVTQDYALIDARGKFDGVDLFERYTVDIVGLTDESISILINQIQSHVVDYIREQVLRFD